MVQLDSGNVLLKPSHRKRLMAWLRRAVKLGEQIGDFVLNLQFRRIGRRFVVKATVHDAAGDFSCRCHAQSWREACRQIVTLLSSQLHDQRLGMATA